MELSAELKNKASIINDALRRSLTFSEASRLHDAMRHLTLAGGKRLRPVIAMLVCEAISGQAESAVPFGVALELAHNFTLLHDDIMDKDEFRRNVPTVHVAFDEPTAIIAGDALFARAFEELGTLNVSSEVVRILYVSFSRMIREIAEGQQMDMEFESRTDVTEQEYMTMIEKKTARIIEVAAGGGMLVGGGTREQASKLAGYGRATGLGFQIWDDVLDLVGEPEVTGKPQGSDLMRGKKTLVVLHALEHSAERDALLRVLADPDLTKTDIDAALNILNDAGSIDYAKRTAQRLAERAKNALAVLPSSKSKELLRQIAEYAVGRDK